MLGLVGFRHVFKIWHEFRGCMVSNLCWGVSSTKEKGTDKYKPTHTCGRTDAHLPHRAMTKPARLPPSLLALCCYWEHRAWSCVVGWPVCCVSWRAQVTGFSCCCHWPEPSELLSHSDPRQRTQSAASLGHSTTSSWGGILRQVQSGLPYGPSWLCCHEIWIQHKDYCS